MSTTNPYTLVEVAEAKINEAYAALSQLKAQLSKPKVSVFRVYKKLDEKFNKSRKKKQH